MADVLILGGTGWLGSLAATHARDGGHAVTCLARGTSGSFPDGVTTVRGDRDAVEAYADLTDRDWDLVVDVSRQPGHVRTALGSVAGRARHWVFVSSGSAYADTDHVRAPGDDPWAALADPYPGDTYDSLEHYSAGKAACELACRDHLDEARLLVARVGLIGGPGDTSDRVGYWPARFALAGDGPVFVPDAPGTRAQVIDVRDLAAWLIDAGLDRRAGVVDAVGESRPLAEHLDVAAEVAGFTGERVGADPDRLTAHGVAPWAGPRSLPLWLPETGYRALTSQDETGARAAGLLPRPLERTLADTLEDERRRGLDRPRAAGLTRADELSIIAAA